MVQVNYDKTPGDAKTKWVYYEGSDTLHTGYALCYNHDKGTAANVNVERGAAVEKPASANLENFAGVVHPNSDGVTGPCYVKIITAGHCEVYSDQNCSGSWDILLWPQNASYALGAADSKSTTGATTNLTVDRGVARSKQQVDRSGTAGKVFAEIATEQFIQTSTA